MNKLVLLLVVTFACVHAEGESSSSEEDIKSLASAVESKLNTTILSDLILLSEKTKKQCPDVEEKLKSTAEEIGTCLKNIDLGEDTLCTLLRNNLEKCAEPAKKLLVGCLPEESKALPGIAIKVAKAVVEEVCNSTVEQILELFNPCLVKEEFGTYDTCTKLKDTLEANKNKVPSSELVCTLIPKIKACEKSHVEASCKNSVTKASQTNFYEAIDAAVASDCQEINKA